MKYWPLTIQRLELLTAGSPAFAAAAYIHVQVVVHPSETGSLHNVMIQKYVYEWLLQGYVHLLTPIPDISAKLNIVHLVSVNISPTKF